jgi:GABA(A) receptor-associated protein
MSIFKNKPLNERKQEVENMMTKFPGKVPIILEKYASSQTVVMDKEKYLVPGEITVGEILYMFRKRIKLDATQALFVFFNKDMAATNMTMKQVYDRYKNKDDGMLYATYGGENTFGG